MIRRALIAGVECGRVALESDSCPVSQEPLQGDWHYLNTCLGRSPTEEEEHAFVEGWRRGMDSPEGTDGHSDTAH